MQGVDDFALGGRVEVGGRFIEEQDGRIFEQGAGDGKALTFTTAQVESAFAYKSIVTLGQADDEVMQFGLLTGFFEVGLGGPGTGQQEIFTQAGVEEIGILTYHTKHAAHIGLGILAQFVSIKQNLAFGVIPKAQQQVGKGGFARAAGTNDGNFAPGGQAEGDIV